MTLYSLNALCRPFQINFLLLPGLVCHFLIFNSYMEWYMGNYIRPLSDVVFSIASDNLWIEDSAIQQLYTTAKLTGMKRVIGMPDLHPGRGYPIGAAFFSRGRFYPALVGNDIGCGMALWQTDILGVNITPINWRSGWRRCLTWRTRSGWRRMSPPQCSIIRGALRWVPLAAAIILPSCSRSIASSMLICSLCQGCKSAVITAGTQWFTRSGASYPASSCGGVFA